MVSLTQLLIPVAASSVAVFVASSVIHMMAPWHKGDFPRTDKEAAILDALRPLAIPPGDYFMPRPRDRADLASPEFAERVTRGPVVLMTVMPNGPMDMRRSLLGWLAYVAAVSLLVAFVLIGAFGPGARWAPLFHTAALVAFGGYALALWQMSIWYRRAWSLTIKATVDGLLYAAITGGLFAWLWPG